MTIDDWRIRIDAIDRKLVELLFERAQCVIEVGKIKNGRKMPILDQERERQIIADVLEENRGRLEENALRHIFECIIEECRRIEQLS